MPSRFSPLSTANFRYFFIGQVVNRVGSSMAGVALAFAVLDISDSASALGVVVAASSIPMVVFMLLGMVPILLPPGERKAAFAATRPRLNAVRLDEGQPLDSLR